MPWSVFTVQAAIFGQTELLADRVFAHCFEREPTAFNVAQLPARISMANGEAEGRNMVVQVNPDRVDLFAVPVQQGSRVFVPLPTPQEAEDAIEIAAMRASDRVSSVTRLAWVIKLVHPAQDDDEAVTLFADFSGIDRARLGSRDNFFQTSNPVPMPGLPQARLNQVRQWRTETVINYAISAAGTPSSALPGVEEVALTLNVDMNVILGSEAAELTSAAGLVRDLRGLARGLWKSLIPSGD